MTPTELENPPSMASPQIIVLRALPGLGDFLCAVPALRALRVARPDATVHLIGLPATSALARRFEGYVDAVHVLPGRPGLPEQRPASPTEWRTFVDRMRGLHADLALQLHGSGETTNDIVASFEASEIGGFVRDVHTPPAGGTFLTWQEAEPEPRRWLRLLRALGIAARDDRLEFPLAADHARRAARLLGRADRGPWAVIHPGSARPAARWPVERFRTVGRALARQGLRIAVTGDAGERALTARTAAGVPGGVDLGGRTDLDDVAALVARARIIVANDTGIAHLATALGTPSVIVFPAGDEAHVRRWAPLDAERHPSVGPPGTVACVLAEVARLLGTRRAVA